jgi:hypothetical protein
MRNVVSLAVVAIVFFVFAASMAYAQRGIGDPSGVARQPVKPEVVSLSGKLVEVKIDPCEATTGRSLIGTHLILETVDKTQLNVHLGPTAIVADVVAKLSIGQNLDAKAFRTDKMKENHYVAQSLTFAKTAIELRDASLRPAWAQGNAVTGGQTGLGSGRGFNWGRGGQGWRRGR